MLRESDLSSKLAKVIEQIPKDVLTFKSTEIL